jgi:hypothetical protein
MACINILYRVRDMRSKKERYAKEGALGVALALSRLWFESVLSILNCYFFVLQRGSFLYEFFFFPFSFFLFLRVNKHGGIWKSRLWSFAFCALIFSSS